MDVKYLLKLCLEAGLREEGVYLYTLLNQHQQALELALTVDIGRQLGHVSRREVDVNKVKEQG